MLTQGLKYEWLWVHIKSLQSCPALCDSMDYSPPGSSVHRILQASILEWFAMLSSRRSSQPRDQACISFRLLHCRWILYCWATGKVQMLLIIAAFIYYSHTGRLWSMGSLRVGHDWATSLSLFTFMHWRRKWQPTSVFLPGESQGRASLAGYSPWSHKELDMTEVI